MGTAGRIGDPAGALAMMEQGADFLLAVKGPDHRVVTASSSLQRFFAGKALLGHTLDEAFGELRFQQMLDLYDLCYRTGEPQAGREWRFEFALGERNLVAFFDFVVAPWRDDDGRVIGVLGRGVDVTDPVTRRLEADAARERPRTPSWPTPST